MIFTTSAFICPGHQVTSLANDAVSLALPCWLIYHEPRGVAGWEYHAWQQQRWPNKSHLACDSVSLQTKVAWIINLYINFPADRKRHVDMSSVSHGDWSWVRWGWQRQEASQFGRRCHTCQFSHSVQSTRFRESLISSFGSGWSLAREQNKKWSYKMLPHWDCVPANFLTAWATDWFLCDGLKSRLGCCSGWQYAQLSYIERYCVILTVWQRDGKLVTLIFSF